MPQNAQALWKKTSPQLPLFLASKSILSFNAKDFNKFGKKEKKKGADQKY